MIAFLRLVRWQNLLFIVITQCCYEYGIYLPIYKTHDLRQFIFLVIASVLIAAAGYIINDYFDLNIDQINKPDKVVVNHGVSRRWAIFWHMLLSLLGFFFTVLALSPFQFWYLVLANLLCIVMLWLYSTNFKRQLLIGNVVISLLTSWVILIIYFSKTPITFESVTSSDGADIRLFRLTMLFAAFAFVISLVREVLKDMEDRIGDQQYGCRTMPIVWGLQASRVFIYVWLIVLAGTLILLQFYVIAYGWWLSITYCLLLIVIPLLLVLRKLASAQTQHDFHSLSNRIKWIMLTGILSMLFFAYYF
ncbi:MAG: geranylgeranylglycerol-phosphate geranylgeranyltransferase [Chitinophagaceae bacterium]|nr:geranylgeranylglycerol-phosphate geranylgeranyltransferase [Chitinophagaceae bacterium]MCA6514991.1 geranylgeranylglycerol-phosphate geranylgeranyltransferase [Chitinophagaceae bacterium]